MAEKTKESIVPASGSGKKAPATERSPAKRSAAAPKASRKKSSGENQWAENGDRPGLVIVESPKKARSISKFLGSSYVVKASMGHVRDLPKRKLGLDVAQGYKPSYEIVPAKKETIGELEAHRRPRRFGVSGDRPRSRRRSHRLALATGTRPVE